MAYQNGNTQPPGTIVVVPSHRSLAPYHVRQRSKCCGMAVGRPCAGCIMGFGLFCILISIFMILSEGSAGIFGFIMLFVGAMLFTASIILCCVTKENYQEFQNPEGINTPNSGYTTASSQQQAPLSEQPACNPSQPAGQPTPYLGQPAGNQSQPAGQPTPYLGQPVGNQSQPAGQPSPYLGQPAGNQSQPAGQPSPYLGQPAGTLGQQAPYFGQQAPPPAQPFASQPGGPYGQPGPEAPAPGQIPVSYQYLPPDQAAIQPLSPTNCPMPQPTTFPTNPTDFFSGLPPSTDFPTKGERPPPYAP